MRIQIKRKTVISMKTVLGMSTGVFQWIIFLSIHWHYNITIWLLMLQSGSIIGSVTLRRKPLCRNDSLPKGHFAEILPKFGKNAEKIKICGGSGCVIF